MSSANRRGRLHDFAYLLRIAGAVEAAPLVAGARDGESVDALNQVVAASPRDGSQCPGRERLSGQVTVYRETPRQFHAGSGAFHPNAGPALRPGAAEQLPPFLAIVGELQRAGNPRKPATNSGYCARLSRPNPKGPLVDHCHTPARSSGKPGDGTRLL